MAGWCPECGEQSRSPKEWVTTQPRDVRLGDDQPILLRRERMLAWTINAWQQSIIAGLLTGISNGRTEGYNRIVKHVGGSRSASQTQKITNAA